MKPEHSADLVVPVAIGVVLGGRLGYVLLYQPSLLSTFYGHLPFWGLLALNEGGMASHGGMIGAILGAGYYASRHHHHWLHMFDLVVFGAPIGVFFGRIANFINGELYGRPCASTFRWAVKFPQEMLTWNAGQLEQLRPVVEILPTEPNQEYLLYGQRIPQIIELIQKNNQQVIQQIEPLLMSRHPSQIYAAVLEGLAVFGVLLVIWIKPRRPGVLAAWAFVSYAVMRIADELFREPDIHIGYQWNLTRGQWLSIALLVGGLVMLAVVSRRNVEPMGGWRKRGS